MKGLFVFIFSCSLCIPGFAINHIPSPQQPSDAYFPNLDQGNPQDPFYVPSSSNNDAFVSPYVITGSDQYSTTFTQSGAMDTVPYHDTGTDASTSYKLQPDWKVPIPQNPTPNRVITYPPIKH